MNDKNILPGISPIGYGTTSAVCLIGALTRLMDTLGDPIDEDEAFALSGTGLCFPWQIDSCCDEIGVIPEIPAGLFAPLGYESEYLTGDALADKAVCLAKIKASIDAGRPVIGFGITVKMPMACLIVGYDEVGLLTRSYWPPEGTPRSDDYDHVADWHENCAGLLIVGAKTGDRLTGAAAYKHITDWALKFRCYKPTVEAEGKAIYINQHAFGAMADWLLNDAHWEMPEAGGKEQSLKQMGLLLFGHYRWQLQVYLKKLDARFPGLVNPPVLRVLEQIANAIPGAHTSDLWLNEAVDPALADFSAMKRRDLRERVADYVRMLGELDTSLQWTLFMPDFAKHQQNGFHVENFEYRTLPAMRFIGAEGREYDDAAKRLDLMQTLDAMTDCKSGFDHDLLFMHHYGLTVDHPWHGVWGRFMKADTPVPDGLLSFDFVPYDVPVAGSPYYSSFAFAKFSGDPDALHQREGFDSDAIYDVTRNIILGDGVNIPYPEKYWTAEVFTDGCDKPGNAYLFSVRGWEKSHEV